MAYDKKYGKITVEREPGEPFGDDEPIFILRGRDLAAEQTIASYAEICKVLGAPTEHVEAVQDCVKQFDEWSETNKHLMKVPD